jgi:hypothetical protein
MFKVETNGTFLNRPNFGSEALTFLRIVNFPQVEPYSWILAGDSKKRAKYFISIYKLIVKKKWTGTPPSPDWRQTFCLPPPCQTSEYKKIPKSASWNNLLPRQPYYKMITLFMSCQLSTLQLGTSSVNTSFWQAVSQSSYYTRKNAQVVTGLQTSCYKSVHKLSTSCLRTACSQLL